MTTKFRYAAYAPNGARIGDIPVPVESSFSSPMNEVSGCTLSYLPNSAGADLLSDFVEISVEASYDNGASWEEIPNGRYMRRDREYEKIALLNARKYTLPGYAWQLNKAIQWETTGLNEDGKRPFLSATVGTILKTLIDEAHVRGTIPGLTYDFDTGVDSDGIAWDKIITIYYEPGLTIYQILDNLAQQGMCDWRMQGRTLQAYNADTVMGEDLSESVVLQPGVDIKALPVKASIENLVNNALVIGDGGVTLELNNPAVSMPWGDWETSISNAGVSDTGTMTLLGTALLEDGGAEKVQFTAEMRMDKTTYFPFNDFNTGSYISGPSEAVGGFQPYRVRQINGRSDKNGIFQVDLIVNDRFVEREIRNAKKTNGIVGGASAGGSGGRPTPPPNPTEGQDTRTPSQVVGLVVSSDVYIDSNGMPAGTINAGWSAVTTATDTTALDVVGYQVAVRPGITGPWVITSAESITWDDSPYPPGATYQVKVRAIGKYTTDPGIWSDISTVVIEDDTTPPSIPSVPLLDARMGVITVTWDGLNDAAGGMEPDFSHIEVAMGDTASPTTVIGRLDAAGSMPVTDQPYNTTKHFAFRSWDTSDNPSDWSVSANTQVTPLVPEDFIGELIDSNNIIDIDGNKVIPGSIEMSRFKGLPHSTNELVNGNFDQGAYGWALGTWEASHGTASNVLRVDPGVQAVADVSFDIPTRPFENWFISVTYATNSGFSNGGNTNSKLRIAGLPANTPRVNYVWVDTGGGFITETMTVQMPVGEYGLRAAFWNQAESNGPVWIDELVITRMTSEDLIVDGAIQAWHVAANAIEANHIQAGAIIAEKIAANAVIADKIAANAVTAGKIDANAVTADKINAGAIDGMVITGATIRTSAGSGRIEMNSSEFAMYDLAGTKQFSITPGEVWGTNFDLFSLNVGRGYLNFNGTKLITFTSASTPSISSMVPGMGTGGLLLVEPMEYDNDLAASLINLDAGDTGSTLGGSHAKIIFGNRNDAGVARYLSEGADAYDNGPQIGALSQGFVAGQSVSDVSFWMKGHGPVYYGDTSYPNNASGSISFQRSTSATWTPTTGVKPLVTITSGATEVYVTGASGFRVISSTSSADTQAGSGATTMFIANDRACYLAHATTGLAANTYISSGDGRVYRSTSASKYKTDIQDLMIDPSQVLAMRPRTWLDKAQLAEDPDKAVRIPGFIAEEVEEAGLGIFVTYHEGEAEGLSYDRITAAHHWVLVDHDDRIKNHDDELSSIREELRKLRAIVNGR